MSYYIVKACSYCGAHFTEWHECAGTERARYRFRAAEKQPTDDEEMLEKLRELIAKSEKEQK